MSGTSGGETVVIVDDGTTADGAWMQRFMDFEPPFELSVRARYDPTTTRTGWIQMAYVFTGTHAFAATFYPDRILIASATPLTLPAIQGTWYNITFDAKAILDVDVYRDGVLSGNVEMTPTNRIIFDQTNNQPALVALASGPTTTSLGMVDYIRTTMCPPTTVGPKTPDRTPPSVVGALLDDGVHVPSSNLTVSKLIISRVTLTATVNDSASGGSRVWSANYTDGPAGWPGVPMSPTDGSFDSPTERVVRTINLANTSLGNHTLCVYGTDAAGNRNFVGSCVLLRVTNTPPPVQNWKPLIAAVFTATLIAAAILARREPRALVTGVGVAIAEVLTGLASLALGSLSIPPALGVGTVLDVGILVAGLALVFALWRTKPLAPAPIPPPSPPSAPPP